MEEAESEKIHAVIRSIRTVNKSLYHMLREEAELMDSTEIQLLTLRYLSKYPNQGLHDLAEALKLSNSTMSGVVERMESAGEIVRERSREDRRLLTMRLTAYGEEKKRQAFNEGSLIMQRLSGLSDLSTEDIQQFLRMNDQLDQIFRGETLD